MMIAVNFAIIFSVLTTGLPFVVGFSSIHAIQLKSTHRYLIVMRSQRDAKRREFIIDDIDIPSASLEMSRRRAIAQVYCTATAVSSSLLFINPAVANADIEGVANIPRSTAPPDTSVSDLDGQSVTLFKTKSGLQYIDLIEGTGPSPKYGNFVSIAYIAYIKLPDAKGKTFKLDEFDSDKGYLIKHGNGRTVPGLDEGLHTMKVGGKRRIIVPPKLGYITSGLGPIPVGPIGRWKLNHSIDRMVELKGGNTIFDVEMKSIMEDEADQGYYDDESLSPEDFNTLRKNLEASQQAAAAARGG